MKSSVVKVLFVLGVLAYGVNGENKCYDDGDCNQNNNCYAASKSCVNHTQCALRNREEGVKSAPEPSQCGDCIPGYTEEKLVEGDAEPKCQKITLNNGNDDNVSKLSSLSAWAIYGIVIVIVVVVFTIVVTSVEFSSAINRTICILFSCASGKRCCRNVESENEKAHQPMMKSNTTIKASAPPAPLSHNKNDYSDAEESFPLSSTRYHHGNRVVASSKPVKAQAFTSSYYVNEDENYNSGDRTEAVGTVGSLPETDEDTVLSTRRLSADQATLNSVPNRPFTAINMEQE